METLKKSIKGYEKFILTVVAMVLAFVGCYKFIFAKQLERREELLAEIATVSQQYDLQEEHKRSVEEIANLVKSYKKNLEAIRADYPPVMYHEEVMFLYKEFMKNTPIEVNGVNFSIYNQIYSPSILSEDLIKRINDVDVLKEATELGFTSNSQEYKFQNSTLSDGSAYSTDFGLTLNGTMESVRDFIKMIKAYHPRVVMKTFSLSGHEDGTVTAPINFAFLGIMDKHVENYSMLDKGYWDRTQISGKENLFVRTDENGKATTDMPEFKYQYDNADFTMRLLNYGKGITPPTVMLAIANPADKDLDTTQIYGDNEGNEEVKIHIEEQDGKYFARIKTETEIYPSVKVTPVEENVNQDEETAEEVTDEETGEVIDEETGEVIEEATEEPTEKNEEEQTEEPAEEATEENTEENVEEATEENAEEQPKGPIEETDETIEIIPKGDELLLYVISKVRLNADDKAGVNITVENTTDKKFVINVVDEDINNPRVNVKSDDVKVYRKYN